MKILLDGIQRLFLEDDLKKNTIIVILGLKITKMKDFENDWPKLFTSIFKFCCKTFVRIKDQYLLAF